MLCFSKVDLLCYQSTKIIKIVRNCLIHPDMEIKKRREIAVFGGNGYFATVLTQFFNIHTYEYIDCHHTKGELWNYRKKAVTPKF